MMTTSTRTEDSTMMSLTEVFRLEEARKEDEARRLRAKEEAAARAAHAEAERARKEKDDRARAAEAERAERERTAREETMRLAGQMLGFVAQAKVGAEARELEQCRKNEHARAIELAKVQNTESVRKLRKMLIASSLSLALLVISLLAVQLFVISPSHSRKVTALENSLGQSSQQVASLSEAVGRLKSEKREQDARLATVLLERNGYQSKVAELETELGRGSKPTVNVTEKPAGQPSVPGLPKCQYEGDPLCL